MTCCKVLANSSSLSSMVYSEIEEIGWEHLVNLSADLMSITFRILDTKGRIHFMEIHLDKTYPEYPPSISADMPYIFDVKWSMNSRLKELVQMFRMHLEKLQEFWSTLDDIDNSLCVVGMKQSSHSTPYRLIDIGNECTVMLFVNAKYPRSLPECRFMGPAPTVNSLRKLWLRNGNKWMNNKTFLDNLASILETQLPQPKEVQESDQHVECGICYAQHLPTDEELGPTSGTGTDYTCENANCVRAFHSVCLWDWLRSITTTRQSFDVLFGSCPYCCEPVAVKINNVKKLRI